MPKGFKGFQKGHTINVGKFGKDTSGWKGNNVGYAALHMRAKRLWGKENKCEVCKTITAKWYEWANLDHKYLMKRKFWKRMCRSCHTKYDFEKGLKAFPKMTKEHLIEFNERKKLNELVSN